VRATVLICGCEQLCAWKIMVYCFCRSCFLLDVENFFKNLATHSFYKSYYMSKFEMTICTPQYKPNFCNSFCSWSLSTQKKITKISSTYWTKNKNFKDWKHFTLQLCCNTLKIKNLQKTKANFHSFCGTKNSILKINKKIAIQTQSLKLTKICFA
jgi:hypothetical protein